MEEFENLKEQFEELQDSVNRLRKTVKKSGKNQDPTPTLNTTSDLEADLKKALVHLTATQEFEGVEKVMRLAFTEEEIISNSVTGKASNSKSAAKQPYDPDKFAVVCKVLYEKFQGLESSKSKLTQKIHAVQKKILRKKNKEQDS